MGFTEGTMITRERGVSNLASKEDAEIWQRIQTPAI